jgi:DNA-directed RNA polymerase specialized sigma subunit
VVGVFYWATDEPLDNLVAAAQAAEHDNTAAMAAILDRFEPLVWATARSVTRDWSFQDDAAQGARIGLVKAVRAHKIGTLGFPAYAKRYMRGSAHQRGAPVLYGPICGCWVDRADTGGA